MTGEKNGNKRILILRSNPVDPDPRVEKEAETLLKAGYTVDIFCWDRQEDYQIRESVIRMEHGTCNVFRIGIKASFGGGFKKNLRPLLKFQRAITSFIKENQQKYSAVHACDFDTGLSAYRATRGTQIKIVYDIFDYYADAFSVPGSLKRIIMTLDSHIINHADGVIICSEQRREQIKGTHPKRLAVIHNSPTEKAFESGSKETDSQLLRIAYVGILSDGRLIPELLKIVSLHEQEYELSIAGFGKLESLAQEYAERCKNIVFHGRTDYSRTLEIENEADVLPAIYDPSVANHRYAAPNKFYEALMLGKPLIMCRNTGMSDLVEEYRIGVCIDYSEESLAEGLGIIRGRLPEYRAGSSSEKGIYREQYSWETMSKRLIHLYSHVL